ncbi:ABC transporter permease [Streptomyces californicus]|uniref:ABC transporter permease n=1 Tax=Streptomyces TaxID=1883 RepID=UPI0019018F7E|nr:MULTISPECIES: ABC transporter permease [Streptomyces]MBK0372591.1 ABC transporter permease [Streptomyces sp. RB110-1]MBK0384692.1 ABC transporter permease [Streptomyces sp. RB110-2]MCF3170510.1 ABC transporter permease [Streptomyces violaceoruber]MDW4903345.1 ABC transporter permease [Streptomyces californicus]
MTPSPVIPDSPTERLRWAVADTWTITLRYLTHLARSPERVIGTLLFPIISILLFGFVFGSAIAVPDGGNYREYLIPGMFAQAMVFGIAGQTVAVATDVARGVTDRFRSMPMSGSAVVVGQTLAEVINAILDITVMFLCGLAVGWRFHGGFWETLGAFGLLLLLRLAATWIGLYLGLMVRGPETAGILMPLIFPLTMIANTFVPTQSMPGVLRTIAEWNPLSATVAACRELFGNPGANMPGGAWPLQHSVVMAVVWPVVIMAVFVPLSVRRYRNLSR